MKTYSSRETAKLLGISLMTLQRYIAAGTVTAPPVSHVGGSRFRAWNRADVERVRKEMKRMKGAAR